MPGDLEVGYHHRGFILEGGKYQPAACHALPQTGRPSCSLWHGPDEILYRLHGEDAAFSMALSYMLPISTTRVLISVPPDPHWNLSRR